MMFSKRHITHLRLLAVLSLMVWTIGTYAQQNRYNWRFGVGVGNQYLSGNPYNSDSLTSSDVVDFTTEFYSYSAFLELSLSQSFGLKAFANTRPEDYKLVNSGLLLSYYFDNDYLFGSKAFIAPYLNAGVAYGQNRNSFNVPFGGGLKLRVSSRININVDYTAWSYANRWDESDFDFGDELRGYSSVSIHYNFGKKPRAYNAPKPYVLPAEASVQVEIMDKPKPDLERLEKGNTNLTLDTTTVKPPKVALLDSSAFFISPNDSSGKAQFLKRYGKILKTPQIGDSSRIYKYDLFTTDTAQKYDSRKSSAERTANDSLLYQLEYEVKQQRLKNELALLRKAEKDSSMNALMQENERLKSQLEANSQYDNLNQRVSQLESRPTSTSSAPATTNTTSTYTPASSSSTGSTYTGQSYNSTPTNTGAAAAGGAMAGGALAAGGSKEEIEDLQAKVDTLQRQLINLQKLLLAQNSTPKKATNPDTSTADTVVADTTTNYTSDSVAVDSTLKKLAPAPMVTDSTDTTKTKQFASEKELKGLKENLTKTQKQVDSLVKVKPSIKEVPAKVEEQPAEPKTFFETTGKVEVFFDVGSSSLNNESRKKLDDMVKYAGENSEAGFLLKGFTDKTGSAAINKALSDKRAKAVQQYITSKGVSAERLKVVSIGPDQSLSGGSQSYGRRVEVILN